MAHETTRVQLVGRRWANIDVEMVTTIKLCWANGIATNGCCQGGNPNSAERVMYGDRADYAYISFGHDDMAPSIAAAAFIDAMLYEIDDLADLNLWDEDSFACRLFAHVISRPFWRWSTMPRLYAGGELSVHANFPRSDIPEINARLAAFAEGR